MNKDKKSNLTRHAINQLEVLSHYYDIDEENRIITIPFHFQKVSELIDTTIKTKDIPVFKNDLLKTISYLLHKVPNDFKIDVNLQIEDYEGYNPEVISKSIIDCFQIFHYDIVKKNKSKAMIISRLFLIGVFALSFMYLVNASNWVGGNQTQDGIRNELLAALGTAVLWEAVYQIFLPSDHFAKINYGVLTSINSFKLFGTNNDVYEVYSDKIAYNWLTDVTKAIKYRRYMLFTGTGMLSFSFIFLFSLLELFIVPGESKNLIFDTISYLICIGLFSITGISGIATYHGKGYFKNWNVILGALMSIASLGFTTYEIVNTVTSYNAAIAGGEEFVLAAHLVPIGVEIVFFIISLFFLLCAIAIRKNKPSSIGKPERIKRSRKKSK